MLSIDSILKLPRCRFRDRHAELPTGQGVYFFMQGRRVVYIGRSNNIRNRLVCGFSGHSVCSYLWDKQLQGRMIPNLPEDKDGYNQLLKDFSEITDLAWLLLPITKSDLIRIEDTLIKQHKPLINRVGLPTGRNNHLSTLHNQLITL